jgi:hypothetical protein
MKRLGNAFRHFNMQRFFKNKKALGAPVGNLIILVAAVTLSTTVVLFAINVTSNQVQKESLQITDVTLNTNRCAISITNTGSTSIRVSQVTVKGDKYNTFTSSPDISGGLAKGSSATLTVTLTSGTITVNDIGRPSTLVIMTTQGSYFTETLVQASGTGNSNSTPTPTPTATPTPTPTPTPAP